MDNNENTKKKFPGWAIALIIIAGVVYLALAAGLVCGAIFMADNYTASHARIGDSGYWMEKSKDLLQNDEALLVQAQETMEQGGITTVTQMDPDDGKPGDTILQGKGYTYRVAYSNAASYTEQAYTMLNIVDTLNERYGIVRIDIENGMIRYEFTRNNDLFRHTEDALCHLAEGTAPANVQTNNISDTYTLIQDGWYLRSYREVIPIFE